MPDLKWDSSPRGRCRCVAIHADSQLSTLWLAALAASAVLLWGFGTAQAQLPDATASAGQMQLAQPAVAEHPLKPAVDLAKQIQKHIEANVKDYSATLVKRERIGDKLGEHEFAYVKVRNSNPTQPFGVYMEFKGPERLKGQECIYVEGQNNGKMFAHAPPGTLRFKLGTKSLAPTSAIAMDGQRYPITEIGIANLTKRLIEVGDHDMKFGECDVKKFQGVKVNGRVCTMFEVTHPVPRRDFIFHKARIYVDDELFLPIRYEAYDWPKDSGGAPVLLEEYTYMNLEINRGFTDAEFDVKNPKYNFPR